MIINDTLFFTEEFLVDDAKAMIIITHGLAEHTNYYHQTAKFLNKQGFNVLLYDVRGHGRTNTKLGDVKRFEEHLNDLAFLVEYVKLHFSLPVFLIGHSMGGVITNAYVIKYHDVEGAIISATPTTTPPRVRKIKGLTYLILKRKRLLTDFDDPQMSYKGKTFAYDPYGLKSFTVRMIYNVLVVGMKYISQNVQNYKLPVLFVNGEDDQVVLTKDTNDFMKKIKSKDKRLIVYPQAKHNLFNETQTPKVLADIAKWVKERAKHENSNNA